MRSRLRCVFHWASRATWVALGLSLATACASADEGEDTTGDDRQPMSNESSAPAPPAGAIRIADDLYAVPIGPDANGCERYRLWSAHHMVVQAIHYRRADGSFTMNKQEAACQAGKDGASG